MKNMSARSFQATRSANIRDFLKGHVKEPFNPNKVAEKLVNKAFNKVVKGKLKN